MRPPAPQPAADPALLARVRAWCQTGALPRMTRPFSAARIAPHAVLDGVACELDGSHALARLTRWQGLVWRLQILLRDQRTGRDPVPGDPWDCGWWREGALEAAAAFRPRRATLLMAHEPASAEAEALRATLDAQSARYTRPVRLLVVSATPLGDLPML